MKRILAIALLAMVLLAIPVVASAGESALERTINAGWQCEDIAGAMHCFDPGDSNSQNSVSINVKVFDYNGTFLGTEQLWSVEVYHGQPCPQDELLDLGLYIACHHYSH